jgi:4-amino-4-deoxy-L-arabinose transferase-like glycosyltransferase
MRAAAAAVVALVSFVLYHATLLPDFDFGDSASFQTMGGEAAITPRDGYPLYYALARPVVPLFASNAYAMNLLSAIEASAAAGVIVLVGLELGGTTLAAVAAALLFAASYTFWSQAVTAEVYGLHLLLVALTLWLLLRWQRRPTDARLLWFVAIYALSFGNHLSMVLLLPAYVLFLAVSAPGGWRTLLSRRLVAATIGFTVLGASQYLWNFSALWREQPPPGLIDAMQTFWFDVTKADWRETMVLEVHSSAFGERLRMYGFDLRQQFGWVPPIVATAGLVHLAATNWRRAALLSVMFAASVTFAMSYNVGDVHVFFLPSHLILAVLCVPGIAALARLTPVAARAVPAAVVLLLAFWNAYWNFPALDRGQDTRPTAVLSSLTNPVIERNQVLIADMNWQIQNGLTYFGQHVRPELLYAPLPEVLLYAPAFIRDNHAIGRDVVVTERASKLLAAAYGPLVPLRPAEAAPGTVEDAIADLPPGSIYVLCVLEPTPEYMLDREDLATLFRRLTGLPLPDEEGDYLAIAGRVGQPPALVRGGDRPFRTTLTIDGVNLDIRMESWLAFDTIRRMGFGHVIANRHHALIVERGISFVAIDTAGRPTHTSYAAGIFEPQPRYMVLSLN